MRRYILKRVGHGLFVMWLVATVVFFGLRAIPGGPVRTMLGVEASVATIRKVRADLGLDRPLYVQYIDWITDLVTLDFGRSMISGQAVSTLIATAGPKTLSIALLGVLVGIVISIPTGIISATRRNQSVDYIATIAAFLGISMPAFFVGILLAVVFGVWFGLLPIVGYTPLSEGIGPWFKSILLPGIAVGLPYSAVIMRMLRSSLLEVFGAQYMRTARAKGIDSRVRLYKHALQNALIPVITVAGIQVALILTGSVTVELVFGIKGIGRLLVESVLDRDYPVIQATIFIVAGVFILTNLVVDIVYTLIDPRIRYEGE